MTKYIKSVKKFALYMHNATCMHKHEVTETTYYNTDGYSTRREYTGIVKDCPMYARDFNYLVDMLSELFACQITYLPLNEDTKFKTYNVMVTLANGERLYVSDNPIECLDEFDACDIFALRHGMLPIITDEYNTSQKALDHIHQDVLMCMVRENRICNGSATDCQLEKIELVEVE